MIHNQFHDAIKKDVAKEKQPYPVSLVSHLKLKRSIIPKDEVTRQLTQLDHATALALHFAAGKLGLTSDEYVRRLIWLSLSSN